MKALVVANWKMNPTTYREAKKLFEATRKAAERGSSSVVIAPPAIYLRELAANYRGRTIAFALQNARAEVSGAHTGDISLLQGKDAKASYVIVGHAERRELGETNEDTQKKVAAALSARITPILCVGERERTHSGEHFAVVREQLRIGLGDVSAAQLSRVVITYEPRWTIGKDTTMSPRDMHEMSIFVRKCIVEHLGEAGQKIKILYGGSVDESNAGDMLLHGDVKGFLVGRASQDAVEFAALLQAIENV